MARGLFHHLPIGIALMLGARHYLVETVRRPGKLDVVGALSSTLGMSSLVYGIVRCASDGWSDSTTVVTFTAGVLLLAVFVINEGTARQPIMPLRLFAS